MTTSGPTLPVPARRPVVHGGAPTGWLDLSTGLSPLGPSAVVRSAIAAVRYDRYADTETEAGERRLADDSGVDPARVVLTAGATAAIRLVMGLLARDGRPIIVVGPTYGEYEQAAAALGVRVVEVRARPPAFAFPLDGIRDAVERKRPSAIVVCDPNNPTGRGVPSGAWSAILGDDDVVSVVVDESFALFRAQGPTTPVGDPRFILIRSLTKLHATPGVRSGFVVLDRSRAAMLREARDPWSPGAHAVALALAGGWRLSGDRRDVVATRRDALTSVLANHGLLVASGADRALPFVMAQAGARKHALISGLTRHRVAVRDTASFGLPDWIRVGVPRTGELESFSRALDDALGSSR